MTHKIKITLTARAMGLFCATFNADVEWLPLDPKDIGRNVILPGFVTEIFMSDERGNSFMQPIPENDE